MNYTNIPDYRPWSNDLNAGDLLTKDQLSCVCITRLHDFGLDVGKVGDDKFVVVERNHG